MNIKSRFSAVQFFFLLSCAAASAQDYSNYTQFFVNPSFINSSYTGMDGRPAVFLSYRKQWAGFTGSPTLTGFNIQAPLPGNLALGATLMNEKQGLISTSLASFTGAYSVNIAEGKFMRFGLSVGGGWNKVDIAKLNFVTPGDNVLSNLASNNFQVMGNAGISFHSPTFHVGVSMPNIFQPVYVSVDAFTFSKLKPFETLIFHASNRFYFSKSKHVFEPYLVYRLRGSLPSQFEAAAVVHLQNLVWLGSSYKQDFGISALAGFKLNKMSSLGYSYSIKNTGTNQMARPSHEIQLSLLLGEHRKNAPPVYSFTNTDKEKKKKSAQELALEKKKHDEAVALEKKKKDEAAALAAEKRKKDEEAAALEKRRQEEAVARKNRLADSLATVTHNESEEQDRLKRLAEHQNDPNAEHGLADSLHAHAERHEFVKKGTHADDMDYADYVIVGAFRGKDNAQRFAKGLVDMNFKEADYGFISARNIWYVYIANGNNIDLVRAERDKYRKMKIFKDAWLLTVQ